MANWPLHFIALLLPFQPLSNQQIRSHSVEFVIFGSKTDYIGSFFPWINCAHCMHTICNWVQNGNSMFSCVIIDFICQLPFVSNRIVSFSLKAIQKKNSTSASTLNENIIYACVCVWFSFFSFAIGYYTIFILSWWIFCLLCRLFCSTIIDLSGFVDSRCKEKKSKEQKNEIEREINERSYTPQSNSAAESISVSIEFNSK